MIRLDKAYRRSLTELSSSYMFWSSMLNWKPQQSRVLSACLAAIVFVGGGMAHGEEANTQSAFFKRLESLCGARFEGQSSFPDDPGDAFRGKLLVARIAHCDANEIRIPFAVGDDTSRTWVLSRVAGGLELKHDHRHSDGTPDEITQYGGTTASPGTELSQSFPADDYTAKLIPEAATNEWFLTLAADESTLTYYLERHGKPRFKATLNRVTR